MRAIDFKSVTMPTMNAAICFVVAVAMATLATTKAHDTKWARYQQDMRQYDETRALFGRKGRNSQESLNRDKPKSVKPNIIFVLTDDQDVALGSLDYMPRLMRIVRDAGANFPNAFVTTPICCPSRSSILTGMYVHNHNVYTNNDNCSSPMWQRTHEQKNFGTYLTNAGYRTGYFGKYLNDYDGQHIPPGWTQWVGLIRNTRFYNYSLNVNGNRIKHFDSYKDDYLTDLIANDSVTFFRQSKQYFPNRPVAMVLSMPAPHGPEDAAPQYQHLFPNVTSHRTPSWNFAPNPDKQWILQYTGKMEPIHIAFTDMLQRKRLQTLQSVDDAIEKVYKELRELGELDNTYWLFTSDHGYHIGQYGLIKGKSMPYDFDVRVPFLMRGPLIPRGVTVSNIALNVDIAPTLLDIAGVPIPEHMDGRSLLELFEDADRQKSVVNGVLKKKKAWRDTFLIERGKITDKKIKEREKKEAQRNLLMLKKQYRLHTACEKAEYQPPCNGTQQWVCRRKEDGNLRIYKCRYGRKDENEVSPRSKCRCPPTINKREKKRQREFLRNHVNQPDMLKTKFIRAKGYRRLKRDLDLPPLANPGQTKVIYLPQNTVILDGSTSTDDHGIISYKWVQSSRIPLPVDMVGTRTPKLHLSNLEAGEYTFTLTVEDTRGQVSSESVRVIVRSDDKSVESSRFDKDHTADGVGDIVRVVVSPSNVSDEGIHGVLRGNQAVPRLHVNINVSVEQQDVDDGSEEDRDDVDVVASGNDGDTDRNVVDEVTDGNAISSHEVSGPAEENAKADDRMPPSKHEEIVVNQVTASDPEPAPTNQQRSSIDDDRFLANQTPDVDDVDSDENYDDYSEYYFVSPPDVSANKSKPQNEGLSEIKVTSSSSSSSSLSSQLSSDITNRHGKNGRHGRRRGQTHNRHAGKLATAGWAGKLWSEMLTDSLRVDEKVSCRVLPNATVVCEEEVYNNLGAWQMEKKTLDAMIKQLKHQLETLKDVKQHLRKQRPGDDDEVSVFPPINSWDTADDSSEYDFEDDSEEEDDEDEDDDDDVDMATLMEEFAEPQQPKKEEECICDGDEPISPKRRHRLPSASHWSSQRGLSRRLYHADQLTPRQQKRLERQQKRDQKKRERESRRQQKQILRQIKRDQKRRDGDGDPRPIDPTRDCNSKNMKCFTHSNEHWKSAPFWESSKWGAMCHREGLDCAQMTNDHWKVAPYWTLGSFCFCPNSNNNTYWCLRTLNDTHNFLYCEFITGFISYYDMTKDPYQLRNAVYDLSYSTLQEMHNLLEKLKSCKGSKECTIRYRNDHDVQVPNSKSDKRRRKGKHRIKPSVVIGSTSDSVLHWSGRRGRN